MKNTKDAIFHEGVELELLWKHHRIRHDFLHKVEAF